MVADFASNYLDDRFVRSMVQTGATSSNPAPAAHFTSAWSVTVPHHYN
jgi:hypothetical protein